jgi:hypothetical protein
MIVIFYLSYERPGFAKRNRIISKELVEGLWWQDGETADPPADGLPLFPEKPITPKDESETLKRLWIRESE